MPQQIKELQLKVTQLERERLAVLTHVDTEKELQAKVSINDADVLPTVHELKHVSPTTVHVITNPTQNMPYLLLKENPV